MQVTQESQYLSAMKRTYVNCIHGAPMSTITVTVYNHFSGMQALDRLCTMGVFMKNCRVVSLW